MIKFKSLFLLTTVITGGVVNSADSSPPLNLLGGIGPYTSHKDLGVPSDTPDGCEVDQVIMYSRHGERFPDTGDYDSQKKLIDKLKDDKDKLKGPLEFIKDYDFYMSKDKSGKLSEEGQYSGINQLKDLGKSCKEQYGDLIDNTKDKFNIFATDMSRVYESGKNFAEGMFGSDWESKANVLQLKEKGDPMNSLTPEVDCRNQFKGEKDPSGDYKDKNFADIADRLNEYTSIDLSTDDVDTLFTMCPFELNVKGESKFCDIFKHDEWEKFEYARSVDIYYDYAVYKAGTAAGSVLTNASLTLMKDGPENVGAAFFEFTHDAVLTEIYAALDIFQPDEKLPGDKEPANNPFRISDLSPMLGRIFIERMSCDNDKYVRVKANDAYVPLDNCSNGPGKSCSLDDYEDYLNNIFESYQDICGLDDGASKYTDVFWKNKNTQN